MRFGYFMIILGVILPIVALIVILIEGSSWVLLWRALFVALLLIGFGIRWVNRARTEALRKQDELIERVKSLVESEGDKCGITKSKAK